jgi:hypothetical protein
MLELKDFNFGKLGSPLVDPNVWFSNTKYVLKGQEAVESHRDRAHFFLN